MQHCNEFLLGQILDYEQPSKYIVRSTAYNDSYDIPVLTPGKSFILGYTSEKDGIYNARKDYPVIIFDDFTTDIKFVDFPFKVKSSAMKILIPNVRIANPKYLFYLMQTIHCEHGTHKRYWLQHYSKIKVSVPSLSEQQRIVAKIEELFVELDNSVAMLKKVREQLEVYKYSVIDTVLPKERIVKLSDCIKTIGQGWSPKCLPNNTEDDNVWAVIKTTAIQRMNFCCGENKILPNNLSPKEQCEIHEGDILITRAGPKVRCGVACMVKHTKKKLLNCDKVYRLVIDSSVIIPEYMEYVLNAPSVVKKIDFCKTGGNDSGLNLTQNRFLMIEIPLPTKNTQDKLIADLNNRFRVCNSFDRKINVVLQQTDALRQSILKKAFEGEL